MPDNATLLAHAQNHMPMGVLDSYRYWGAQDSMFIRTLQGGGFTSCEGREYVDFRLAYGPIILGYRDERVDSAVISAIRDIGTVSGFSTPLDAEVVELIKSICPNIEKMRFANSGTEAVMGAVRVARGFTGRDRVLVVEGGFHGLYDEMMWRSDDNGIVPFGGGLPEATRANVDFIELNDPEGLAKAFEGAPVAAVVLEPIMGNCGSISATQEYMENLRQTCTDAGTMLIIDEVKTGFRVALGGAQQLYGVHADLTTYAKAMGNGYPVAAFGGRADVMDVISFDEGGVTHGGTYTANLIALAAAEATLTILKETDALTTVDAVGARIQELLGRVFTRFGVEHTFAGPDAMFGVHFSREVPMTYRDWKSTDAPLYTRFAKNLIEAGVMLEPDSREPWFICEAHQTVDLAWLEETASGALEKALR
ncbi:MAG: aminotransferase class III-fold pyridoxal phosphate-dependent enzyme [Proteobacteria bacterium]|nr:aminotransferase class III-fold pyridoxal phosphate-dependent enzyme [Pseudomonadota bacterium]MCP4918984.1 aminotransferase class III-fold pyridoxal phosphate-dependent enzyme [Pseudomonadota bacterium]